MKPHSCINFQLEQFFVQPQLPRCQTSQYWHFKIRQALTQKKLKMSFDTKSNMALKKINSVVPGLFIELWDRLCKKYEQIFLEFDTILLLISSIIAVNDWVTSRPTTNLRGSWIMKLDKKLHVSHWRIFIKIHILLFKASHAWQSSCAGFEWIDGQKLVIWPVSEDTF